MLVLSRKENEKICIGDNIVITVLRVRGNVIRLGIDAPQEVRVLRAELPSLPQDQAKVLPTPLDRPTAPLGRFFPKSVELTVGNLSV
jgi:carbon storage regulator CsrA